MKIEQKDIAIVQMLLMDRNEIAYSREYIDEMLRSSTVLYYLIIAKILKDRNMVEVDDFIASVLSKIETTVEQKKD